MNYSCHKLIQRVGKHAETSNTPTKSVWFLFEMYRSQFTRTKSSHEKNHIPSFDSGKEFTREELSTKFISKVTIQLGGNKKKQSKKLANIREFPLPKGEERNHFISSFEKNVSKDKLSHNSLRLEDKRPVGGSPRTLTPEPRLFVSPTDTGQGWSRSYSVGRTTREPPRLVNTRGTKGVSGIYSIEKGRKLFHDSTTTNNLDSTEDSTKDHADISSPSEAKAPNSHHGEFPSTKHWYIDIMQRLEDLNWNYQTLETEYSFLEKLMNEQKEDLRKAKSWSKHPENKTTLI